MVALSPPPMHTIHIIPHLQAMRIVAGGFGIMNGAWTHDDQ